MYFLKQWSINLGVRKYNRAQGVIVETAWIWFWLSYLLEP